MNREIVEIANQEQLQEFANRLAKELRWGWVIGLVGELGAGKTTLVRYLCTALGSSVPVSSPTFTLAHEYPANDGQNIEHWDLYRLSGEAPEELFEPPSSDSLRIIEWYDKFASQLGAPDLEIAIEVCSEHGRLITMQSK